MAPVLVSVDGWGLVRPHALCAYHHQKLKKKWKKKKKKCIIQKLIKDNNRALTRHHQPHAEWAKFSDEEMFRLYRMKRK